MSITVDQAKAAMRHRVYPYDPDEGMRVIGEAAICPCCEQHVQVYRWSLYATAIQHLAALYAAGGIEDYVESKQVKRNGQGDGTRLRYFDLAHQSAERREDGGKSGWWRVTRRGREFLFKRLAIPKYAIVYNGDRLRYDGPDIYVNESGGRKFDYGEMMRGTFGSNP